MTRLDLRLGARRLCRAPGFALAAIVLLGISIGGPTLIFSVVRGLLFQSLLYNDPERLAVLTPEMPLGGELYSELQQRTDLFENVAAYTERAANLTGEATADRVQIAKVTASFLPMTGVHPSLGRLFLDADYVSGSDPVALISDHVWRRRYNGSQGVIGQTLTLDTRPYTIVGVLPAHFKTVREMERSRDVAFDRNVAVLLPLAGNPQAFDRTGSDRKYRGVTMLVRLRTGVSVDRAGSELAPVLSREQSRARTTVPFSIRSLAAVVVGELPAQLAMLSTAVALLLVVGCANVANLILGRIEGRRREVAVAAAIGASRHQIVGGVLGETLILSTIGGAFGLLFAWQAVRATKLLAGAFFNMEAVGVDLWVLGFAAALSVGSGILVGAAPAARLAATDPAALLQREVGSSRKPGRLPLSSVLVVTQIALAVVLVVVGALLGRALVRSLSVDPGFATKGILTAEISLDRTMYWQRASTRFFADLLQRVKTLPGVEDAAVVGTVPGGEFSGATAVRVAGRPYFIEAGLVSRAYFTVLSIPLIAGRVWSDEVLRPGVPVQEVVVNEALARDHWGDPGNAIGQRITLALPVTRTSTGAVLREPEATIVGVVADSRDGLAGAVPKEKIYYGYEHGSTWQLTLLVRAPKRSPGGLAQAISQIVKELHPDPTLYNVLLLEDIVRSRLARERTIATVMNVFAVLTLLVSALGVYAAMSYAGALRRHEVGVRLALGGTRTSVLRTLAWRGVKLVSVGIELGILFAVISMSLLRAGLFGTGGLDWPIILAALVLVIAVSSLALLTPAWRATRVDPIAILRAE